MVIDGGVCFRDILGLQVIAPAEGPWGEGSTVGMHGATPATWWGLKKRDEEGLEHVE